MRRYEQNALNRARQQPPAKRARTARATSVGDADEADEADEVDDDDDPDTRAPAKPAAKPQPASAARLPSPSKLSDRRLLEETLRAARGAGKQHRLGEVEKRKKCNVKGCGNTGARLGCRTCGIHLCSPECYNAHAFDDAELCGKMCATFLSVSKFKAKKSGGEGEQ